jgi:hypothetical protein
MGKPTIKCREASVFRVHGGYVLCGQLEEQHHTNPLLYAGRGFRSSLLLKADFLEGRYETLNTIYVDVDKGGA